MDPRWLDIHFLQPELLWLLAAGPLLVALPKPPRDWTHGLLRLALLSALALALARPIVFRDDDIEHHAWIVDRTPSVHSSEQTRLSTALSVTLERLDHGRRTALIDIGDEDAPLPAPPGTRVMAMGRTGESPLGDAMLAAATQIPIDGRGAITLISDGLATDREHGPAVLALQERGIPVHTVRMASLADDLVPVALESDEPLRAGRVARLRLDVVGRSDDVSVTLSTTDRTLATAEGVVCDGRATVMLEFEPPAAGFLTVTAEITANDGTDAHTENNLLRRTFAVQDPWRVLYLGGRTRGAIDGVRALLGDGFDLVTREPVSEEGVGALADYDLVFIDDRPASEVPDTLQRELVDEVSARGTGLFLCGGTGAFGPGGYHQSTLETVLPVEFVQKEEKRDPSTSLVIIIDTSGSMGGERVQLAKEVARLAISRLLPHDKVGIVEFYGSKRWAAPLQPASNAIDIQRALNRLDAGGGTVILPAIEEAFYGLQNVNTRYKHVLILTDGGVETGAFEPLLRKMADKGINTSTVLIGPDAHSEFLVTLSNWGKGRFYSVPNRFNLPEILLKQPASARLPAYRPGRHTVLTRGGPGWWGAVDRAGTPALDGYVESRARDGAEVLVETEQGHHPIVSTWRYGLGRVTCLTTEPAGRGTSSWRGWDGYASFLGRVAQRTAGDARDPFRFSAERRRERLVVRAERRAASVDAEPRVTWVERDGGDLEVALREIAPGVYEARLWLDPSVEARFMGDVRSDARSAPVRFVSPAFDGVAAELQVDPAHTLDLQRLAESTGGVALEDVAELARFTPAAGGGATPLTVRELWPPLLVLALLLYLLDLAWRRRPEGRVS